MKKASAWMLILLLIPGVVALTGCAREEGPEEVEVEPAEPMMETSPMMEATPMMQATPMMDTTPMMGASPTPAP